MLTADHLVRFGAMAHVGRFRAADAVCYPRGTRVILRTARGLEVGDVLALVQRSVSQGGSDGAILRGMTSEDELLEARLRKNRHTAYEACRRRIAERGLTTLLMDVEHLFDGRTLIFYFLGPEPPEFRELAEELADTYDAQAQIRRFADTLTAGCGPGCGTEDAEGNGCQSCASGCAVARTCGSRRR